MASSFISKLTALLDSHPVVLELDLARGMLEARPTSPLQAMQLLNSTTLTALRKVLEAAAKKEQVKGLIVHASATGVSASLLEEVGIALERFGQHKPTVVWSESFGEGQPSLALYKMAAAAQEIWLHPTGMLAISGIEAQIILLKGALNKIGVEPQFGKRHEYKTAADQFAADEVSAANREMMTSIVTSVVDDAISAIAARRNLDKDLVRAAVQEAPLTPERAVELGLIDHIGYRDEAYASVLERWEAKPEHLRFVSRYSLRPDLPRLLNCGRKRIGVISVRGPIVTGRGSAGIMGQSVGSDVVDEQLRHALRDDDTVAVLLDVDSPGGSAVASAFIRRGVAQLRAAGKPVVARMGAVAASGGYYVSMPADEIVALPTTLTGSIGVLSGKMVTQGLYDKLGVIRESITVDPGAAAASSALGLDEEGWRRLNEWLDRVYLDFTTAAAQDRAMEYEVLEPLARGRVWTGTQAKEHALVDHLGGFQDALERLADLADVSLDAVDVVPIGRTGLLSQFAPAQSSETVGSVGVQPWTPEAILEAVLRRAGINGHGVLSMPFGFKLG